MRLIDAESLIEYFEQRQMERMDFDPDGSFAYLMAKQAVQEAATVDAEPVRHGHWIKPDSMLISCICSACGFRFNFYEDDIFEYPYCASCGAKMDEEIVYDYDNGGIERNWFNSSYWSDRMGDYQSDGGQREPME